jgi:hypothetical protein
MAGIGFWSRLKSGITNLLGAGRRAKSAVDQPPVSPPEEVYPPYEEPSKRPPIPGGGWITPPPMQPPPTGPIREPLDVRYIKRHKVGSHTVLERWKIGNNTTDLDMDDIHEVFRTVGYREYYTFLITGVPKNPYPGKEGQHQITLSYRMNGGAVLDFIDDHMSDDNSVDWFTELTSGGYAYGGEWESINSIDVVDR